MLKNIADLYVLLVEPSVSQRKIIDKQFKQLGVSQLDYVSTGKEALASIRRDQPDLVISSMYLEDVTGTELLLLMRNEQSTQDVGFMLISSETKFSILDPVRQAGASAILPKPFNAAQLKHALCTSMDFIDPDRLDIDEFDVESLKVLVVDDSGFARRQIQRTLRKMGIENFMEATNGGEAIALIDDEYFDLVVTDYNMPEVDGCALVDYIRKNSQQSSVPILMVTTEGDQGKLAAVEQAGVSAICDKPFEPSAVKKMLEQILIIE